MGNVVDSSGKAILDSSGKPIKTGSADAAKVSKNGSTSGADILTPEQKKYFCVQASGLKNDTQQFYLPFFTVQPRHPG